jgi:cell volume regulation protein A
LEAIVKSNSIILLLGLLMVAGVLSVKFSARAGVPALVLFVGLGMVLGQFYYFDDAFVAQLFGTFALIAILFDGGLNASWPDVKPVMKSAISLATVGVVVTSLIIGLFAHFLLNISWLEGMLFGSIVGSTDAAAIFAVVGGYSIRKKLAATLEAESGSNDPMAIFLTLLCIQLLTNPATSIVQLVLYFLREICIGAVAGYFLGKLLVQVINRIQMQSSGLYPILSLACAVSAYALTAFLGGSGFLAVYIMAIVAGNSEMVYRTAIFRFNEGFAWMMQIFMFVLLGWLVFPEHLISLALPGFGLSLLLMFVARPIGVWISTARTSFTNSEKTFIAWAGLKGAVPIVLATYPLLVDLPNAYLIFNATFFVVLTSALLQGASITPVARRLGLIEPTRRKSPYTVELVALEKTDSEIVEIEIQATDSAANREIRELALPDNVLIVALIRNGAILTPRGETRLLADDMIYVLTSKQQLHCIYDVFSSEESGYCEINLD